MVTSGEEGRIQEIAECLQKRSLYLNVSVVATCFDNPTTYLPYMEGKAVFVALPSIYGLIPSFVANILQSPVLHFKGGRVHGQ